ncbi:MAG: KH domain-containing protein [Ruminococcaceae bacterium]|nr:KH domain-containing protein [Oscillospiraceae bacterium]
MVELKKILSDIAKGIVDSPDDVVVTEEVDEDGDLVLILSVAPDDMGKVIGKHGKIARAIRLVIKSASTITKQRVTVEIR